MQHSEYKTLALKLQTASENTMHAARTGTVSDSLCSRLRCGPCWLDRLCRRPELGQMQPELPLHSGERRHGQVVAA